MYNAHTHIYKATSKSNNIYHSEFFLVWSCGGGGILLLTFDTSTFYATRTKVAYFNSIWHNYWKMGKFKTINRFEWVNTIKVPFSDFGWKVCQKCSTLVTLYWFGGKMVKNRKSWSRVASTWFILVELPIVWLVIGFDYIFNIEIHGNHNTINSAQLVT